MHAPRRFVGKLRNENELFNNQMHQDAHESLSLDAEYGSVCPDWRPRGRVFRRIPLCSLHSQPRLLTRCSESSRGPSSGPLTQQHNPGWQHFTGRCLMVVRLVPEAPWPKAAP